MNLMFNKPKQTTPINNGQNLPFSSNRNMNTGKMGMNFKFLNTVKKNCHSCGRG
jgi:hypothetical protein